MELQFDHIIHFMDKPEDGMDELNKRGIHTVKGGSHENRGSYNTLSYFGLSYIELLGIHDQQLFANSGAAQLTYSPFEDIAKNHFSEGFAKINLRTRNLEEVARKLTSHGIKTNGPIPLSRRKPDGSLLEWELLYVGGHSGQLPLPFFIDWGVSDQERFQSLKKDGTIKPYATGELSLSSILFAVRNAKETATLWESLFDLETGKVYTDETLQALCYPLKLGEMTFIFASPLQCGKLSQTLEENGEHPYILTMNGAKESTSFNIFGGHYQIIGH